MGRTGRMVRRVATVALAIFVATAMAGTQNEDTTAWVCPMHSDYTSDAQGACPRCGMALVHAAPFDVRDYKLDFRTIPSVVRTGQKATLLFRIEKPGTREVVRKFEVVHERQFHLFVISQNMEDFEHIHPRELADGTWTLEVETLGFTKLMREVFVAGAAPPPQFSLKIQSEAELIAALEPSPGMFLLLCWR